MRDGGTYERRAYAVGMRMLYESMTIMRGHIPYSNGIPMIGCGTNAQWHGPVEPYLALIHAHTEAKCKNDGPKVWKKQRSSLPRDRSPEVMVVNASAHVLSHMFHCSCVICRWSFFIVSFPQWPFVHVAWTMNNIFDGSMSWLYQATNRRERSYPTNTRQAN